MVAVLALVAAVGVFSYVMSSKSGFAGRGVVERLGRYIPLQSVKIIVVAWQILTQVSLVGLFYLGMSARLPIRLWGTWHRHRLLYKNRLVEGFVVLSVLLKVGNRHRNKDIHNVAFLM